MSKLLQIATLADKLGLRTLLAQLASLAYKDRRFVVDDHGRWVNIQSEGTIVSPDITTMPVAKIREVAEHNWFYRYRPKEGDTIVDLGAGIGDEVIVFSKLVGKRGRVIAIEAAPATFACLVETVRRSSLDNVTCLNVAVDENEGTAYIEDGPAHLANSIRGNGGARVRATSLDTVIKEQSIERIDLLKVNIEGAERMAVRGLNDGAPVVSHVAISCHDFLATSEGESFFRTKEDVMVDLEKRGFDVIGRDPIDGQPWVGYYVYGEKLHSAP